MNHRSRKRIVDLCNLIRKPVDGIEQRARSNKEGGFVRVFVSSRENPYDTERNAQSQMAEITCDKNGKYQKK